MNNSKSLSSPAAWLALCAIAACSNIEEGKPVPQPARVDRSLQMDVPEILRGTIASESIVLGYDEPGSRGYQPIIARGYGLVVGLNGTGSRNIPPPIRAHMLAEASRGGFGSPRYGDSVASISPEALLDSPDTAVVIVEAIIPQGAPAGTKFDVRVVKEPATDTESLEGGILYTTLLRPGTLSAGGKQAFEIAQARGTVVVNPFAEPGAVGRDDVQRTIGRIMNGGEVVKDMPLKLRLANPSHARAKIIEQAINTRFPQEIPVSPLDPTGQREPTARGESDELIKITVPPSWRDHTEEFLELLRHTTITQGNPEATAMFVKRTVLANPLVAKAASLRWQALGSRALPIIKDLYDYPEEVPRMAALAAGAKLDDGLVVSHLIAMARSGSADARLQAINLLTDMRLNPQIDQALRALLDDDDVEVRLQAYEALVARGDPYMRRYDVDGKFILDVIESKKPLIYVTQVGQPRIAIFDPDIAIDIPITHAAWSNRLIVRGDVGEDMIEVYYRDEEAQRGVIHRVRPGLEQFVQFLGHETTIESPSPGLALSYSETVGALHSLWADKRIEADFKAEQDRILAAIMRMREAEPLLDRPEFTESPNGFIDPAANDLGRIEAEMPPITATAPGSSPRR